MPGSGTGCACAYQGDMDVAWPFKTATLHYVSIYTCLLGSGNKQLSRTAIWCSMFRRCFCIFYHDNSILPIEAHAVEGMTY